MLSLLRPILECCVGPGVVSPQVAGTRSVLWKKTSARDASSGKPDGQYLSIVAMPQYAGKSFEELRWEDYQVCFYSLVSLNAMVFQAADLGLPAWVLYE